jgi:hypothetical protein
MYDGTAFLEILPEGRFQQLAFLYVLLSPFSPVLVVMVHG